MAAVLRADIPPEVYLTIADHLSLSSLAALLLTNKHLLHIYGSKYWELLKDDERERADFLLLLERDLPDFYYSKPLLRKRVPASTPRNCTKSDIQDAPSTKYTVLAKHFNYIVIWSHLVLALKRDLYGGDHGIALDAFTHSATTTIASLSDPKDVYTFRISIDPKIVSSRLLLRCTYNISSSSHAISTSQLKNLDFLLCHHTGTVARSSRWYDNTLSIKLRAPPDTLHHDNDGHDGSGTLLGDPTPHTISHHCAYCMTDYHLSPCPDGSYTIVTWQNLGDSYNYADRAGPEGVPSPRDSRSLAWDSFTENDSTVRVMIPHPVGCVKEGFEEGGGEKWSETIGWV